MENMVKCKITSKTQWENGNLIFIYFLICIIAGWFFVYFKGPDTKEFIIIVLGCGFLSQLLPQLALHLNYYFVNKDDILAYDPIYKETTFTHNGIEIKFFLDDVASVIEYKSFALQKKNDPWLTFDNYNHAVITLNNGVKILVTSLLIGGEFTIPVDPGKVKVEMNIYRWANGPSLQIPNK